jgi:hypothetical protein
VSPLATRQPRALPPGSASATVGADRWLGAALLALAAVLAAEALLGPLVAGVIRYPVSTTLESQAIGLDAVSLFVVAPLAASAAALVLRGHPAGAALALGVGAYSAYMAAQFVVGPEYTVRPGNSERAFVLFLLLFVLGWAAALRAWRALAGGHVPASPRRDRLVGLAVLPALAGLAFVRYVPAVLDASADAPSDAGYLAGPTFFWVIALLDLGIFLPATVATCVGLVRRDVWAHRLSYLVAGWFGLVGPAVAAMAVAMEVRDDPNASSAGTVFMTALGLTFVGLTILVLSPLARPRRTLGGSA